jgi:hypothetical protein
MAGWIVEFHPAFGREFEDLAESVRIALAERVGMLSQLGPALGRPHCDSLAGSQFANMKELRLGTSQGAWRVAFAFDPRRRAILLVAGDKSGGSSRRFYRSLIDLADRRYDEHLLHVEKNK